MPTILILSLTDKIQRVFSAPESLVIHEYGTFFADFVKNINLEIAKKTR